MGVYYQGYRDCRECENTGDPTCPTCDGDGRLFYDNLTIDDISDSQLLGWAEEELNLHDLTKVNGRIEDCLSKQAVTRSIELNGATL